MCPPPTSAVSSTLAFDKRYARRSFHKTGSTAHLDIQILRPPSIATAPPVTNSADGETRRGAVGVVSSAVPNRPTAAAPITIAVLWRGFISGLLPPYRFPGSPFPQPAQACRHLRVTRR